MRFDGKTGRPLAPMTPEASREHTRRTIEANRRWLREQAWWRRASRAAAGSLRVLLRWGTR